MWNVIKYGLAITGILGMVVAGTAGYKTYQNAKPLIENAMETLNNLNELIKLKPKCSSAEERQNDPQCKWTNEIGKDAP